MGPERRQLIALLGGIAISILQNKSGDRQIHRRGDFEVRFLPSHDLHRQAAALKQRRIIGNGPLLLAPLAVALPQLRHLKTLGGLGSPEVGALWGTGHLLGFGGDNFNGVFDGHRRNQPGAGLQSLGAAAEEIGRG